MEGKAVEAERNGDSAKMKDTSRESELYFIHGFIMGTPFENEVCRDQLRCLWTAYCLRYDLTVDTAGYDNDLLGLWHTMEDMGNGGEPETADRSDYDSFDEFMCRYLV